MRQLISRIILILLLLISLAVGCFPVLANSTVYHILYLFLLLATVLYLIIKIKSGNFKYNIFFLIILGISILGVFYRKEKHIIDALGLVCILFSYYIFEMSDIDEKFLNKIALLVSFSVIPTLIFNGMFNQSIIAGTAFSGRLNPFMYFPYILIAIQYNKSKQMLSIFLKIILIFVFIDIIWSGSRVAFLSMVVMSIMYIFLNREKGTNTNFSTI